MPDSTFTVEQQNSLYWEITYAIEPVLRGHVCRFDAGIDERRREQEVREATHHKVTKIMEKLREFGLLQRTIVPSPLPPEDL